MKKSKGLYVGWLDTSIGTLLTQGFRPIPMPRYALVTSVDSSADVSDTAVGIAVMGRFPECEVVGSDLLIPGAVVANAAKTLGLFTGFDEVWWFDRKPVTAMPVGLSIVSPLRLDTDPVPGLLESWMIEVGCQLGLGDGIGMNYASPIMDIAQALEAAAR